VGKTHRHQPAGIGSTYATKPTQWHPGVICFDEEGSRSPTWPSLAEKTYLLEQIYCIEPISNARPMIAEYLRLTGPGCSPFVTSKHRTIHQAARPGKNSILLKVP